MNVFFEGCCHGELDEIYKRVGHYNLPVDLLLIGGDFQAVRNEGDLLAMNVPPKYRAMHDFHKYYSGEATAPFLTIIIGGNHESSGYMQELYHGGWLAPNIYYLGAAGVVNFRGLRIGGVSGIYNYHSYRTGHYEQLPYDESTIRSVYHIRSHDVMKAALISNGIDIFMSHDWPAGIEQFGDTKRLLREKKHFYSDIQSGRLGSPPAMNLLKELKPRQWLSAHLHCKFVANVVHEKENGHVLPVSGKAAQAVPDVKNPDEIDLDELDGAEASENNEIDITDDLGDEIDISEDIGTADNGEIDISDDLGGEIDISADVTATAPPTLPFTPRHPTTQFMALDKCLPRRQCIARLDIPNTPTSDKLQYDPEWLSIVRCTNHLFTKTHKMHKSHPQNAAELQALKEMVKNDYAWVKTNIIDEGKLDIPDNFALTATAYSGADISDLSSAKQLPKYTNPQTVAFHELLQMTNKL